jgi:Domain of unknown function (DUF4124)
MFQKVFVLIIAGLLLTMEAQAGKLYKVVDENGKVTYTQYPPTEKKPAEKIKSINIRGAGNAMIPVGNTDYCGELKLPRQQSASYGHANFLQEITSQTNYWTIRLKNVEKSIAQSTHQQYKRNKNRTSSNSHTAQRDMHYRDRKEKQTQQAKELRCALHWAKGKQDAIKTFRDNSSEELTRLQQVYITTQQKITRTCGPKPAFDPNDRVLSAQLDEWELCSKQYHSDLMRVERKMRTATRNIESMK